MLSGIITYKEDELFEIVPICYATFICKSRLQNKNLFVTDRSPMLGDFHINPTVQNALAYFFFQAVSLIFKFGGFAQNGETNF